MANILQRYDTEKQRPSDSGDQVRILNGEGSNQFDLVDRIIAGDIAYVAHRTITIHNGRPFVEPKAHEAALEIADKCGYDLALVEKSGSELEGPDYFLAQFYVCTVHRL